MGALISPPALQIRYAVAGDVAVVTATVRSAYTHYVARIGREPWPMTVDYRHAISDQTVWVAVLDGQVVGLIVLHKASDHLLIDNIAVDPAHQGGGVGTALMAFAEAQARDLRLFELRLYTNELMVENLAYYARRGYRESGRGIEAGFRRVYFVKELTDGTSRHD